MAPRPDSSGPAETTRSNLIAAGFELFGTAGYAATSTRRLAERAGTNVASIAYHFGGKAGLHAACAQAAAERIADAVGAPRDPGAIGADAAVAALEKALRGLAALLLNGEQAASMVGFLVREMNASEEIVQILFDRFVGPKHRELCALWAAATGRPAESEEVRLSVFSMIGQVLYFRLGQPVVLRGMGWDAVGPDEAGRIAEHLVAQLRASIDRSRI
ncbi:CerR family C-terminal domain-containing protein [Salipiger sp. P9]|uniref:CerR family C-terminal domain-containing protein n=1 Tax=Salipiger pentaromativorans TaxID=2943193 RepID=UPI0021584773|nr:CerR family C-terminal domain-containing protein [Salipiger pentaromativorans]MCR8547963.1 CerR family C-terminal domain-containing protein [Salipiger pentaromativorans]